MRLSCVVRCLRSEHSRRQEISGKATAEVGLEEMLAKVEKTWEEQELIINPYKARCLVARATSLAECRWQRAFCVMSWIGTPQHLTMPSRTRRPLGGFDDGILQPIRQRTPQSKTLPGAEKRARSPTEGSPKVRPEPDSMPTFSSAASNSAG